jgi:Ca-activated chloride channel family protein
MAKLMRCLYCGLLQDEPKGVKECSRCGGELAFEQAPMPGLSGSYLEVQMELDQVSAPAGQTLDRYLLVTLRAPKDIPSEQAAPTASGRPPVSFTAVIDVSGSMRGEKLEYTKQAVRQALRFLHDGDTISLAAFSDQPQLYLKPTLVNSETRQRIESVVAELQAGGMTALDGGLELGIQQALEQKLDTNLLLLLSDGQANIGETELEKVGQRASAASHQGLVVSTLGVGSDYNEALMTEISVQGRGRFYHVQAANQIVPYLTSELGEAADLAARQVQIQIHLPQGALLVPLSASYKAELVDGRAMISIGDIPRDLEVEIPLRLTLLTGKAGQRLSIEGEVSYTSPAGNLLTAPLNRVTVRMVAPEKFQLREGVVMPVAEQVARQMRAAQVLQYSRAMARSAPAEMQRAEQDRIKLRDYLGLLGQEVADKMVAEMDDDLYAVRAASPLAKSVMANAFQAQRFMRKRDKD